jgi:hypothetical protein
MPGFVPNLTRVTSFASAASWFVRRPSAIQSGSVSRLDASMMALSAGSVASTVAWGFDMGPAPKGSTRIVAAVSGRSTGNMAVNGLLGVAGAFARITMSIDEFSPNGFIFMRRQTSLPTAIFDSGWPAYIGYVINQVRIQSNVIGVPVVTGNRYRVWVNLEQAAAAAGFGSSATSNATYDFGPVFCVYDA